jgi:hypothetical protein
MDMNVYFPGGKKVNANYKGFTIETDQAKRNPRACFWHPSVRVPEFMSSISARNGVLTHQVSPFDFNLRKMKKIT